ncbi:thermonuclease family protein [Shimia thalassica]|uniref:thermonuclease family protein n=1 Tax=Shimia thalassica TaxID=1715693 RepID=UPI0026E1EBD8|nr:thermonuclease family protein [Shimia thalassica]MDO6478880.1 thermonuclease family protein [Shimia thalassica]
MELLIGALILAAMVFFVLRGKTDQTDYDPPKASRQPSPPPRVSHRRTPRFDGQTAKHVERERVLTGPAWITDGDTIKIAKQQIRLFGIDAPELNHPHGENAKWALHKLCKGQIIRAEITDEDEYGRVVARCYLPDGRDLSAEMVKQSMAIDWPKFSGGKYTELEAPDVRKKLFLADARQKGRMHIWEKYEARQKTN